MLFCYFPDPFFQFIILCNTAYDRMKTFHTRKTFLFILFSYIIQIEIINFCACIT